MAGLSVVVSSNPSPGNGFAAVNITTFPPPASTSSEESKLAPAILYTVVLMVMGAVGNSIVCYVYGFRWQSTVTKTFIFSLAALDLLNCLICMPTEIVMLVRIVTFDAPEWCKVSRFLTYTLNGSCSLILVAIALDRWYKVCRPLKYFFTAKRAKLTCACALILAAILSSPSIALYGSLNVPLAGSDVMGVTCLVSNDFIDTWWPLVFYSLYFSCYLVLVVVITVLYSRIAVRLVQLKKQQTERARSKYVGLRSSKLLFPSQEMIPLTKVSNNNNYDGDVSDGANHHGPHGDRGKRSGVRIHMICEEAETLSDADCVVANVEIVRQLSYQRLEVIEEDDGQKEVRFQVPDTQQTSPKENQPERNTALSKSSPADPRSPEATASGFGQQLDRNGSQHSGLYPEHGSASTAAAFTSSSGVEESKASSELQAPERQGSKFAKKVSPLAQRKSSKSSPRTPSPSRSPSSLSPSSPASRSPSHSPSHSPSLSRALFNRAVSAESTPISAANLSGGGGEDENDTSLTGLFPPERKSTWNFRGRLSKKKDLFKNKSLKIPTSKNSLELAEKGNSKDGKGGGESSARAHGGVSIFSLDDVSLEKRSSDEKRSPSPKGASPLNLRKSKKGSAEMRVLDFASKSSQDGAGVLPAKSSSDGIQCQQQGGVSEASQAVPKLQSQTSNQGDCIPTIHVSVHDQRASSMTPASSGTTDPSQASPEISRHDSKRSGPTPSTQNQQASNPSGDISNPSAENGELSSITKRSMKFLGLRFSEKKPKKSSSSSKKEKKSKRGWSSYREKTESGNRTELLKGDVCEIPESREMLLKNLSGPSDIVVGCVYEDGRRSPMLGSHKEPYGEGVGVGERIDDEGRGVGSNRQRSGSKVSFSASDTSPKLGPHKASRYPRLLDSLSAHDSPDPTSHSPLDSLNASYSQNVEDDDISEFEQGIHFASPTAIRWNHNPLALAALGDVDAPPADVAYIDDVGTDDRNASRFDDTRNDAAKADDVTKNVHAAADNTKTSDCSVISFSSSGHGDKNNSSRKVKKTMSESFALSLIQRTKVKKDTPDEGAGNDSGYADNADNSQADIDAREIGNKKKPRVSKTASDSVLATPHRSPDSRKDSSLLSPPPGSNRSSFHLSPDGGGYPGGRTPTSRLPTPVASTPDRLRSDASAAQLSGALILERLSKKMAYRPAKTTRMLFAISIVFVLSFLPFFVVVLVRAVQGTVFFADLTDTEVVLISIFIRSSFLSNAANPIIYGLCNKQFRTECWQLIGRCSRRKRNDVPLRVIEQTDDILATNP